MTSETCAKCGAYEWEHPIKARFDGGRILECENFTPQKERTCANCGKTEFWCERYGCKKFIPHNHSPQKQEGYADVKAKDKSLLSSSGGKQK